MAVTGIVPALTTYRQGRFERVGQLLDALATRCDREGLDVAIIRQADSRGAMHAVTVTNWRNTSRVSVHADDLTEALDLALDELNRRTLA